MDCDLALPRRAVGVVLLEDEVVHLEGVVPVLGHLVAHGVEPADADAVDVELGLELLQAAVHHVRAVDVQRGDSDLKCYCVKGLVRE